MTSAPHSPASRERRQVAWLAAGAGVLATILVGVRLTAPPPAPRVNVRWAAGVTAEERADLERRLALTAAAPLEGTTWSYDLRDPTPSNIAAIIGHPAVEDTYGLDRSTRAVAVDATLGTTRIGVYPLGAWVESRVVRWMMEASLWTMLLSGAWLALNRSATPGTSPHTPRSSQPSG